MTRPEMATWHYEENKGYSEAELPAEVWEAQQAISRLEELLRERRQKHRDSHPVPEILYHYTDLRGLHGMLQSFMLWLSDPAFMNDPLEGSWVYQRAASLAKAALGDSPLAEQSLRQIRAQLDAPDLWDESFRGGDVDDLRWAALNNSFMPAFIASFTENGDLLSQWRAYGAGGDGLAIGFDLNQLGLSEIQTIPHVTVRPTLVKVEYNTQKQDAEIAWIFSQARQVYEQHIHALSSNSGAESRFMGQFHHLIRSALSWLRWEFKSPHYEEEQEWRLMAHPYGVFHPKTRVSGRHIVPYVEMPLPQKASRPLNELAIPRIVLGPRCDATVVRSIRILLQNLAYPEVVRSKISLR